MLLTLRAHQYHGYILSIAKMRHFGIVIVDGVETGLVLQAKHKDYRIHPAGKLQGEGAEEETNENKSSLKRINKKKTTKKKKRNERKTIFFFGRSPWLCAPQKKAATRLTGQDKRRKRVQTMQGAHTHTQTLTLAQHTHLRKSLMKHLSRDVDVR